MRPEKLLPRAVLDEISPLGEWSVSSFWRSVVCISFSNAGPKSTAACAAATLARFVVWEPLLREVGLPIALVGQDGAESLELPWGRFDALFLGGSTEWKLGPHAAALAREAKRRGLWVHMGRCNTRKRFRHAFALGCDSVDGSGFSRWPDQRVPLALRWMADLHGADGPVTVRREPADRAPEFTTDDWNHINPFGGWTHGRDAVLAELKRVHNSFLKDVSDTVESLSVRFASDDVAVAIVTSHMGTYYMPDGTKHENERQRRCFIVVRRSDRWLIMQDQNTLIR